MKRKSIIASILGVVVLAISFLFTAAYSYADCLSQPPSPITATPGQNGQVMLSWNQPMPPSVSQFSLVYGLSPNTYWYGVPSVHPDTRNFTVGNLAPGKKYYFQVWSFCDNNGSATPSQEVNAASK